MAGDTSVVPGNMGPFAIPVLRLEDAVIGDDVLVEISGLGAISRGGGDQAVTPYFRLMIPFRQLAALEFDGMPIEAWQTTQDTQLAYGAQNRSGVSKGDIRFGARFYVFRETEKIPAFGVRFMTKSTTGKDFEDHRHTNAPAYYLDALAAKTLLENRGFIRRLRVMAQAGFLAWQQGSNGQDDAVTFGAAVETIFQNKLALKTGVSGYAGWEKQDKPVLANLEVSYPIPHVRFLLGVDLGITKDAPAVQARIGVEFNFEIPYIKRRRPPGEEEKEDMVRH